MNSEDLKIDDIIFHRDIYNYRKPLTIIEIKDTQVLVFGVINDKLTTKWLSIDGISKRWANKN